MTLCTQPEAPRPQRRPGRPPSGKKQMAREMPGKLRAAYRRSLDPCDNSNDSGLGFDHHTDPHHHTMLMSERLTWTGERAEPKRLRMDIKLENEDVNDNYCFPNTVRQCKDNISLIRTAPSGSVPSLSVSNNTSSSSGKAVPRCTPILGRQAPTTPISLVTQLTSASRFGDISLTILKQPEQQHRARYQTEGSRGAVKDREGNGFPVVQLTGYYKPATLQVYIGTDVGKVSPHMFYQACKVSGKNSTPCVEKKIDGTCVIELSLDPSKEMCATCDCVGILKERNVDVEHRFPEQLGNRSKKKSTRCRMIFRTTITHDNGTTETLQVCSQPVVCTQPPGIPEICKKSLTSCPASGGLELFVLGKNFLKDTKVYFQQYDDGRVRWEQAVVPDKEYLQQTHFVCVVPPYRTPNITEPVSVRLCVVSSGKTSESHQFVYTPVNGAVSVHLDAQQAQPAQFFKGAIWNTSSVRKQEQDLDMMPPPDSNLVPISTRRSSVSLPSTSEIHSPPLNSMKQEYIEENSQGSIADVMDIRRERYRPISESSLDVNHDSNISMINDNSIDMMHHNSMMSHISENSNLSMNEDSMEMARRNSMSMCENDALNEENACNAVMHPIVNERVVLSQNEISPSGLTPMEKVMDLRMKLPMNTAVSDYVTTASSIAALQRFGIEPSGALPTQSAQSVENYLTTIESKPNLLPISIISPTGISPNKCKDAAQSIPNLLAHSPQNMGQSVFLTSQQPFLTESSAISSITKSEAAAIAEQTITGATSTSTASTTITTALGGSISTPINKERLDEILNVTLESHMGSTKTNLSGTGSAVTSPMTMSQDVILGTKTSLLAPPVINARLTSPVLGQHESQVSSNLSPEAIINSQISQSLMCPNSSSIQQEPLISGSTLPSMCQNPSTTDNSTLLPRTISASQSSLLPTVTAQESVALLNSEPEKAVLLEAAVDFLKTQKKICEELTTTAPDIIGIASLSTDTSVLAMQNNMANGFMPYSTIAPTNNNTPIHMSKNMNTVTKSEYIPISVKDIATTTAQNDKKNEDRMIPQSFTSLTENELINLINPSCFDQGTQPVSFNRPPKIAVLQRSLSKCHKKMTSEDIIKIFNPRRILLKRSASATGINIPNLAALNLRDTKSFTGNMEDIKTSPQKALEKINGNDDEEINFSDCIETKDIYNNDTIVVNKEALVHKGKRYSINDIAFCWKKDCRMWLWKNTWDLRKNKSVGEHLKAKLIKG